MMLYLSRGYADETARGGPTSPSQMGRSTARSHFEGDGLDGTQRKSSEGGDASEPEAYADSEPLPYGSPLKPAGAAGAGEEADPDAAKAADAKLGVKRKCSNALLNMSLNDRMKAQFLEQGGLKALLQLALSTRDEESVTNCAACLVNLVAFGDYYEPFQVRDFTTTTICDSSSSSSS